MSNNIYKLITYCAKQMESEGLDKASAVKEASSLIEAIWHEAIEEFRGKAISVINDIK